MTKIKYTIKDFINYRDEHVEDYLSSWIKDHTTEKMIESRIIIVENTIRFLLEKYLESKPDKIEEIADFLGAKGCDFEVIHEN